MTKENLPYQFFFLKWLRNPYGIRHLKVGNPYQGDNPKNRKSAIFC